MISFVSLRGNSREHFHLPRVLCVSGLSMYPFELKQTSPMKTSIPTPRHQSARATGFLNGIIAGCILLLFLVPDAQGAFHLWGVDEIYSSADGSVQFIELTNTTSLENALGTHTITCSGPLGTHTFAFPTNLTSTATANKTFIIGTSNLASQPGGLVPDYVLTNNPPFLFTQGGGAVSVGISGSFITPVTYTNLPSDGDSSLVLSSGTMVPSPTNSPRNFQNQSNSLVAVKFLSSTTVGTNFVMSFRTATGVNGAAGPAYTVEYKNFLTNPVWTPLVTNTGNGTTKSVTNPLVASPSRMFRLNVH